MTMDNFKDHFAKKAFGKTKSECEEENICVTCHKPITEFRNKISDREYAISGMCQTCQDLVFGID